MITLRHILVVSSLMLLSTLACSQALPIVNGGKVHRLANVKSAYVAPRHVDVWLPPGYNHNTRYPVLYMHDGQMLFDTTLAWNRQEWRVDETITRLLNQNLMAPCIVVGIWNNGANRISEYLPNTVFNSLPKAMQTDFSDKFCQNNGARGDAYLAFIVTELKPLIDTMFNTLKGKENTFIAGSSMGALISLYAQCQYPEIFGGTACMSTTLMSWLKPTYLFPLQLFNYLHQTLPAGFNHKMYMDYGLAEVDSQYIKVHDFVNQIYLSNNFNHNFKFAGIPGAHHTETDWANRLHLPLTFLLPPLAKQNVSQGHIDIYPNCASAYVESATVEVWLPPGYSNKQRYDVLYMHDGQMLFDSTLTWNHQSWNVAETASRLMETGQTRQFIVVAIHNPGSLRYAWYFPQQPYQSLTPTELDTIWFQWEKLGRNRTEFKPMADHYLKFLVSELKPFIDKTYSTHKGVSHTFIAGSSMGGLISWYALCEYPQIFGGAACLSTHWPGMYTVNNNPIPDKFMAYLKQHLPNPKNHKLYFDYGNQTLDSLYPPYQKQVDTIMLQKGFTPQNWKTLFFDGNDHSETAWKNRFEHPLLFLMTK
jgi:predicted alpha/beta superfamily hydrolase